MNVLVTVFSIIIFVILVALFGYLVWKHKNSERITSSKNQIISEKEKKISEQITKLESKITELQLKNDGQNEHLNKNLEMLKKDSGEMSWEQKENKNKMERVLNKINDMNNSIEQTKSGGKDLTNKIETLNNIFISNYQRGKMGEASLYLILESILGRDSQVVQRQYLMKNGNRPDAFIAISGNNIAIDCKFPYNNFVKMLELNHNSSEYEKSLTLFKKDIETHVKKISTSYISTPDNVSYAIMYLPSQPVFDLIFSEKKLTSITELANKNKVVLLGPNTLPVVLRIVDQFLWQMRFDKKKNEAFNLLKEMGKEFQRFGDRWKTMNNRITGLKKDAEQFGITTNKISNKFKEVAEIKTESVIKNIDVKADRNELIKHNDEQSNKTA